MGQILGIDYAWQHPNPADIKAAGYSFVARYLSYDGSKDLQAPERDALFGVGLGITLVWEAGAQDVLGGAAQGQKEGAAAVQLAQALGYPAGYPIFFATDFDEPANDFPTNAAYLTAAAAQGPYQVGPYGSLALCNAMISGGTCHYAWQTEAWSGTGVYPQANLYQRVHPTLTIPNASGGFDEDVVIVPFPIWSSTSNQAPVPAPAPGTPPPPAPAPGVPPAKRNVFTPISVDGAFGPHSIQAEQFVSYNGNRADCDGVFGIGSKKSMQAHLGVTQDGVIGPNTVKHLQAKVGANQDGVWGTLTTEALQKALNAGNY